MILYAVHSELWVTEDMAFVAIDTVDNTTTRIGTNGKPIIDINNGWKVSAERAMVYVYEGIWKLVSKEDAMALISKFPSDHKIAIFVSNGAIQRIRSTLKKVDVEIIDGDDIEAEDGEKYAHEEWDRLVKELPYGIY